MAKREEEVILKLEVDQAGAEKELQRVESAILDNRKAIQDLNKSFKDGKVSQADFVKESVKLQSNMKREQDLKRQTIKLIETESNSRNAMRARVSQLTKEYNNLNLSTKEGQKRAADLEKQLKKLNDEINEGSKRAGNFKDNIGRYTQSIVEASKQITIHGTNVGGLISTLKSFTNPVTAVIAAIGALTTAYATSSVGARDYGNAVNQIGAAFEQAQNNYGKFIQSQTGGGGPSNGPLSRLAFIANQALFGTGAANQAKAIANAKERIEILERAQVVAAGEAKEAERLAEIQRRVRDDENNSFEERLKAIKTINNELTRSAALRTTVNNVLKDAIRYASPDFEFDYVAQNRIVELNRANLEIAEEVEGKKTENLMSEKAILDLQNTLTNNARRTRRDRPLLGVDSDGNPTTATGNVESDPVVKAEKVRADAVLEVRNDLNTRLAIQDQARTEAEQEQNRVRLKNAGMVADALTGLFKDGSAAQQILQAGATIINTYSAATAALAPPPTGLGPVAGIPLAGATIATGLANLLQIRNVKFARGGYTGSGFGSPDSTGYKPAGVVHEHEYVVPKRLTTSATAQPHIAALESMRLRPYAAGGLVTNMATGSANEALTSRDAFRNIPNPVLDVSETMKVMKTIEQRERVSKLSRK
jgi:hypothetical protein